LNRSARTCYRYSKIRATSRRTHKAVMIRPAMPQPTRQWTVSVMRVPPESMVADGGQILEAVGVAPEGAGPRDLAVCEALAGHEDLDERAPADGQAAHSDAVVEQSALPRGRGLGVSTSKRSQGGVRASRLAGSEKKANTSPQGAGRSWVAMNASALTAGLSGRPGPRESGTGSPGPAPWREARRHPAEAAIRPVRPAPVSGRRWSGPQERVAAGDAAAGRGGA
jgi:hypothetical protein